MDVAGGLGASRNGTADVGLSSVEEGWSWGRPLSELGCLLEPGRRNSEEIWAVVGSPRPSLGSAEGRGRLGAQPVGLREDMNCWRLGDAGESRDGLLGSYHRSTGDGLLLLGILGSPDEMGCCSTVVGLVLLPEIGKLHGVLRCYCWTWNAGRRSWSSPLVVGLGVPGGGRSQAEVGEGRRPP
ncbi:hypothetical protein MLD38_034198 [Melastoma candidum]|uniref:Uncharacterized protein n=1 Tax=Melastoma candidum TaxID=119954 RepID=A0ACB9M9P5_9MYRT|nr:hypothetical protein MLD38_034198 [Melastoma candidum]